MSDYRAIAGVTGTLQQFLYGPLSAAIPGTTIRTGPPSASLLTGGASAVNIFLYQVNPNSSWRNAELPVRRTDGSVEQRPQAALDLYYILSFYGAESKMVPQLLLGAAISALHAFPMLDKASIPEFLDGKSLEACGLAEQAQVLKFTLMPLSHEELGRIWSVFFQVPYTLSVAYQCSVLLLEPDLSPAPALPVLGTRLGAMPWEPARIERVEPAVVEYQESAVIRLEGAGLAGSPAGRLVAQFGDLEVAPSLISQEAVEVELPPELSAGTHSVRLVYFEPASRSPISRSNPVAFVLLPKVIGPASFDSHVIAGKKTRTVSLPVVPPTTPGQSIELLLHPRTKQEGVRQRSYQIKASPQIGSKGSPAFSLDGVEVGEYFVRVEINGVASRLATDDDASSSDFGCYIGPRVTIQ